MKKIMSKIILIACMVILPQQAQASWLDAIGSAWNNYGIVFVSGAILPIVMFPRVTTAIGSGINDYVVQPTIQGAQWVGRGSARVARATVSGINKYGVQPASKFIYDYRYPLIAGGLTACTGGAAAVGVTGAAFASKALAYGALAGVVTGIGAYNVRKKDNTDADKESRVMDTATVALPTEFGIIAGDILAGGSAGATSLGASALLAGIATVKHSQDSEVGRNKASTSFAVGCAAAGLAAMKVPRADNRSVILPAVLLMASSWMNGLWKTRAAKKIIVLCENKYGLKNTYSWYNLYDHADCAIKASLCYGVAADRCHNEDKEFFAVVDTILKNSYDPKNAMSGLWGDDISFDAAYTRCNPVAIQSGQQGHARVQFVSGTGWQVGHKFKYFAQWHQAHRGAAYAGGVAIHGVFAYSINSHDLELILKEYKNKIEDDLKKICKLSSVSFKDIETTQTYDQWKALEKRVKNLLNCAGTGMMLGHLGYSAFHNHRRVNNLILKLVKLRKCIMQLLNVQTKFSSTASITT